VSWQDRFKILHDLIVQNAHRKGQLHHCTTAKSGTKDNTHKTLWLRDQFGLNSTHCLCLTDLLEHVAKRGLANLSSLIELGLDVFILVPCACHVMQAEYGVS
jgi:hypothetical protein